MATRGAVIGSGVMGVLEFGGRVLEERGADILVFMRITRDIATRMYYTGIDPFKKQAI